MRSPEIADTMLQIISEVSPGRRSLSPSSVMVRMKNILYAVWSSSSSLIAVEFDG